MARSIASPGSIRSAIRRAIVEDNRVRPDYAHIRVPVLAIYRTMTMDQVLQAFPPKNDEERMALTQAYAAGRAMLSKWQRDLREADIIRELRAFASSLPVQSGAAKLNESRR